MAKYQHVPKTAREARRRRFKIDALPLTDAVLERGLWIAPTSPDPDAFTWCGPCEPNGYRRCCYKDQQGNWICHSVPCRLTVAMA